MIFSERLTELRKDRGLSQKECANLLKIEPSKYNKWENGKNAPDYDTVCMLADYFTTTTDYLLGHSGIRFPQEKVNALPWQEALLRQTQNSLNSYYLKYNEYIASDKALDLENVVYLSIRSTFAELIAAQEKLIAGIQACPNSMVDLEKVVNEYLSTPAVSCSGKDFEIELFLRDRLEHDIPGYKEFRNAEISAWIESEKKKSE